MKFGERLKSLREEKSLNQDEFATIINKSRSSIAGYEIDNRLPDHKTLFLIADYFGCSLDYLLGRADYKNNSEELFYNTKVTKYGITLNNAFNKGLIDKLEALNTVFYRYFQENIDHIDNLNDNRELFENAYNVLDNLTSFVDFLVNLLDSENRIFLVDKLAIQNNWIREDADELYSRLWNETERLDLLGNFNELSYLLGTDINALKTSLFNSLNSIHDFHYKNLTSNFTALIELITSLNESKSKSNLNQGPEIY